MQQIAVELKKLLGGSEVKVLAVTGGRDFEAQKHKLDGKSHVLIGTPGRLLDHIRKGNTNLGGVKYLVLDGSVFPASWNKSGVFIFP